VNAVSNYNNDYDSNDKCFCKCNKRPDDDTRNIEFNKAFNTFKETLISVYSIGDLIDIDLSQANIELPWKELVRIELIQYCLYLCSLNDMGADRKSQIIKDCLNQDIDAEIFKPALKQVSIIKMENPNEPPVSFKLISLLDKRINTKGGKILINAYKQIAKLFLSNELTCMYNTSVAEGYRNYISMLESYIESECGYTVAD